MRIPNTTDVSEARKIRKIIYCFADTGYRRGPRECISLIKIRINPRDIKLSLQPIPNLHRPHFFQSAAISSSVA